ncbi:Sphingomyelin phosphodiesterase [Entamoeba marina]
MNKSTNRNIKIIVLGDSYVGKTSLINQFVNRKYSSGYKSTVGVDLSTKSISIGDNLVSLQIWDPSGTERFRSMSESFFRGTDGCILVCSVTSNESFTHFDSWMEDIIQHTGELPFIAVANKSDVDVMEWDLSSSKFETWCKERQIPNFMVSAKDASNVESAFTMISEMALKNSSDDIILPDAIDLSLTKPNNSKSCC